MQYVEVPCKIIILLPLLGRLRGLGLFGSTVLTEESEHDRNSRCADVSEYTNLLRTILSLLA